MPLAVAFGTMKGDGVMLWDGQVGVTNFMVILTKIRIAFRCCFFWCTGIFI